MRVLNQIIMCSFLYGSAWLMSSWRVILWVRDITLSWHLQEFLKTETLVVAGDQKLRDAKSSMTDVEKIWGRALWLRFAFVECWMLHCQWFKCVIESDIIGKITSDWTSRAVSLNTVVDFLILKTRVLTRCCLSDSSHVFRRCNILARLHTAWSIPVFKTWCDFASVLYE